MIRLFLTMKLLRSLGLSPVLELRKHDPRRTKVARGKKLTTFPTIGAAFRELERRHIQSGFEHHLELYCLLEKRVTITPPQKVGPNHTERLPLALGMQGQTDVKAGSAHVCDTLGPLVDSGGAYRPTCSVCTDGEAA